jgi:predicted RNase H-like HicB family nuclease
LRKVALLRFTTCPILPELITEADTLHEVQANVADALAAVIEIYEDAGRELAGPLARLRRSGHRGSE